MSFVPISDDLACDGPGGDASNYREVLHGLIEIGADLARLVQQQARAEGGMPAAEAVVAFERVSRAVRRTIRLAQTLDEPVRALGLRRRTARRQVIRAVEDRIQREADGAEADSLHAEFVERLDGPDLDEEIGDRPVAEIIADICRDLGLGAMPGTRPWKRRVPADVAVLCARAAAIGGAVLGGWQGGGTAAGMAAVGEWGWLPWSVMQCAVAMFGGVAVAGRLLYGAGVVPCPGGSP